MLWMSPQYERDSVAIHFTWEREPGTVRAALVEIEAALEPFAPRPHWGKLFLTAPSYPRAADFAALASRLDPRGAFQNDWTRRFLDSAA
jgi:xylitol oxidase